MWFCGAALVPIVATTVIAAWQISKGYRDDFDRRLLASHEDAQRAFDRIKTEVKAAVDAAGENPMVSAVLLELSKNGEIGPAPQRELERNGSAMLPLPGLQVLTLLDRNDLVLAAPH